MIVYLYVFLIFGSPKLISRSSEDSWFQAVGRLIGESGYPLEELSLDCLNEGLLGYESLDLSKKLRVLNFLCDEAVGSE